MNEMINHILRRIERKSLLIKEQLLDDLADAHSSEKEAIEAGIVIETWLAESVRQCRRQ